MHWYKLKQPLTAKGFSQLVVQLTVTLSIPSSNPAYGIFSLFVMQIHTDV